MKYSTTISMIEFLSKPQERLLWTQKSLPNDELSTTNAIVMQRYVRYPLVIDPSDQALKFIMELYKDRKIQKTSFVDTDFMSRISEGLQYGVPILIQDVEKIDPVMNSVLNKEMKKVGGRLVIQVGDKEIACTGELTLFMFTRNADAKFTPDLCSRVTFVNFTVTPSSLRS
jgi:dynein heavy chain 1